MASRIINSSRLYFDAFVRVCWSSVLSKQANIITTAGTRLATHLLNVGLPGIKLRLGVLGKLGEEFDEGFGRDDRPVKLPHIQKLQRMFAGCFCCDWNGDGSLEKLFPTSGEGGPNADETLYINPGFAGVE